MTINTWEEAFESNRSRLAAHKLFTSLLFRLKELGAPSPYEIGLGHARWENGYCLDTRRLDVESVRLVTHTWTVIGDTSLSHPDQVVLLAWAQLLKEPAKERIK